MPTDKMLLISQKFRCVYCAIIKEMQPNAVNTKPIIMLVDSFKPLKMNWVKVEMNRMMDIDIPVKVADCGRGSSFINVPASAA